MRCLLSIITILFICFAFASAQGRKTKDNGSRESGGVYLQIYSPYMDNSIVKFEPMAKLICNGDTLFDNGSHVFRSVPVGKVYIISEADGFLPKLDSVVVEKGKIVDRTIFMSDRVVDLQIVVVDGHVPALVFRNDTLKFSPNGMNFADDDRAREVLKRMPGVEISDGQIKIGGKPVKKTYVDGRTTLFGDNPMTAIDHIKALDVARIYSYDEDEHPDETNRIRKGKKQRVINIETKSKMINSYDGVAFAGVGPTLGTVIGNRDLRYTGGASFNFFSDQWLLQLNAIHNNQNSNTGDPSRFLSAESPSSSYSENTIVSAKLERKWQGQQIGKDTSLSGEYSFSSSAPESTDYSETIYNPTQSFTERQYISQNLAANRTNTHNANFNFSTRTQKYGNLYTSYGVSSSHLNGHTNMKSADITDGIHLEQINNTRNHSVNTKHNATLYYDKGITEKLDFALTGSFTNTNDEKEENRFSSVGNSISTLFIPEDNRGGSVNMDVVLRYGLSNQNLNFATIGLDQQEQPTMFFVSTKYGFSSDNRHISRIAEDLMTGNIDEANTYKYRNQTTKNSLELDAYYYSKNISFSGRAGVVYTQMADDRKDKNDVGYDKNYVHPEVELSIGRSGFVGMNFSYSYRGQLPDIPQVRNVINDENQLNLTAGNPDLRPANMHSVTISYSKWKLGAMADMLMLSLSSTLTDNFIISKTDYFKDETFLEKYNYMAKAGSSLSSYANYGRYKDISCNTTISKSLSQIQSRVHVSLIYNLSQTPYYYITPDAVNSNTVNCYLTMSTERIKNTTLSLSWNGSYQNSKYKVNDQTNEIISNGLVLDAVVNRILKRGFVKAKYAFRQNHYVARKTSDIDNLLNIYAGVSLKYGIELSLTAYDILNNDSGRNWSVSQNYSRLSYRENYGRYISVNLKWNLSKVKSNRIVSGPSLYMSSSVFPI